MIFTKEHGYNQHHFLISTKSQKLKSSAGYTLVEMIVAIAIISIMVAIFVGSYSFGKNFDALKSETQRFTAVLRNARIRDFNGIVHYTKICAGGGLPRPCIADADCTPFTCSASDEVYPPGGYGINIDTNYMVCSNDSTKSCTINADCISPGLCTVQSNRTNFILFADFSNPDGGSSYDGGKAGSEFITEYKLPSNLTMKRQFKNEPIVSFSQADILFNSSALTVFDSSNWAVPIAGSSQTIYIESVGPCTPQTRNQKGAVEIGWATTTTRITDQLINC